MLIPLDDIVKEYNIINGSVLHIGGHTGEEAEAYAKNNFNPVYWVEGDIDTIGALQQHVSIFSGHSVIQAVIADSIKEVTFNIANNEQSSSILKFKTHSIEHPEVVFTNSRIVTTTTIDNLFDDGLIGPVNFLNLDIQGAELLALKGASNYLDQIVYIYTEVNEKELYEGCVQLPELDQFLNYMGYERKKIEMTVHGWGDALYVRRGKK